MIKDGILVVGSTNMDMVVTTDQLPRPGETILGKKFQTFPGGKGANQAVGVAKLGKRTLFVTKMGDDEFKNKLIENLSSSGVDVNNILIDENESTGIAVISVDAKGENEIIVVSGSNMKLTPEDINARKKVFEEAEILLTQLEIPLDTILATVDLAKQNNLIVILNPAPARLLPDEIYGKIDFITPNETELETLTGIKITGYDSMIKAANFLLSKGVKNVIVTIGEKGSLLVNNNSEKIFEARKVEALDTTAAGDAFNAGFAFALSQKYSVEDSIKFANAAAGIAVTRMGAQTSMPSKDEVSMVI